MKRLFFLLLMSISVLAIAKDEVVISGNSYYSGGRVLEMVPMGPVKNTSISLEKLLLSRGEVLSFSRDGFTTDQLSHIIKLGYGYGAGGNRTVESFDSTFSILIYLITRDVVYVFIPAQDSLGKIVSDDIKPRLMGSAGHKSKNAYLTGANIIIAGSPKQAGIKRPREGRKFMFIEAGKIAQNMELAANSIGIGFEAEPDLDGTKIRSLLKMPSGFEPIMMLSLGRLTNPITPDSQIVAPVSVSAPVYAVPSQAVPVDDKSKEEVEKPLNVVVVIPQRGLESRTLNDIRHMFELSGSKVQVAGAKTVLKNSQGGEVVTDLLISNIRVADYDILLFVDGPNSTRLYEQEDIVMDIMYQAYKQKKVVRAYGLATGLLARSGVLSNGTRVTGNPAVRRTVLKYGGDFIAGQYVVTSGKIVTAYNLNTAVNASRNDSPIGFAGFVSEMISVAKK